MKFRIQIYIVLFLCLLITERTEAQIDTVLLQQLDVIAETPPLVFSETGRMITVIDSRQIQNAPAQHLNDLLRHLAGVDIRQRGSHGVQADVSMRGGTFDQTLILLNGIKINDPQTGHHSFNIPVDLQLIERIEVLKGPAARIYGANAFAGAINIITSEEQANCLNLYTSAGDFAYINAAAGLKHSHKGFQNHLMVSHKSSEGYMENTDYTSGNLFWKSSYRSKRSLFSLQQGLSRKTFGAQSFYTPQYPNQYEALENSFTSISLQTGKRLRYRQNLWYRINNDRFELFRSNPLPWYAGPNFHQTKVMGSDVRMWFVSKAGLTGFGGEVRRESIMSNVLGELVSTPMPIAGEPGAFFTHAKQRDFFSLYADHTFEFRGLILGSGIMVQTFGDFPPQLYPGIEAGYRVNPRLRMVASLNKTLRLPTFTDLYYSGPTNTGNPDLKPEEALAAEAGLEFLNGSWGSSISLFRRYGKNLIDWVKFPGESKYVTRNLTDVEASGLEMSMAHKKMPGDAGFINLLELSYTYANLKKNSGEMLSYYVMDYLKHKMSLRMEHTLIKGLSASWYCSLHKRNGSFVHFPSGEERTYSTFLITDLKIRYHYHSHSVFVEASNLFNAAYYDLGNIPMPGRWIRAGLNICVWRK